ncbi:hypothetical protein EJV47_04985 [Hymenobacter gummosus]|uniref:Uncharacterized protein n=1 Tax=Hymenobacter gummosus TaxID=1776032 RepID=A0A3S0K7S0_9BACT|nr:hypothetical protein [Hymenobacter gummosus]RTQ52372.1 hypothetical protein EJV47_04985 [Hymenobacter gummosus]
MRFSTYSLALLVLLGASLTAQAQDSASTLTTAAGGPASPAAPATADIEAYVRTATVTKGSELDFEKVLAGKKQTVFLHNGSMYNKREYGLVLWGLRVKALGVSSAERACSLYVAAAHRALSPAEKRALVDGFDSGTAE